MNELINTKPELEINFSDLPPGSYIVKDGKLLPNLNDEAMLERSKKDVTLSEVKEPVTDILPAEDADVSDA